MTPDRRPLTDFGERTIVRSILAARYGTGTSRFGDDTALVTTTAVGAIVATTDPAPQPVAWELGFRDYYTWGWLIVALNLSDLAAAGALPLGLLTSLTLRPGTSLADFTRLLDGIDDCCAEFDTRVIGGNLREARYEHCEATAFGAVASGRPMSRTGAAVGDAIVAFGPSGMFWAAVLSLERKLRFDDDTKATLFDALVCPRPQLEVGRALRQERLATACTDASDGVYAGVCALTTDHGLGAIIERDGVTVLPAVTAVAAMVGIDPLRLILSFGNLELVATVAPENVMAVRDLAFACGVHLTILGTVDAGPGIRLCEDGIVLPLANFDNERFTAGSQFTAGLAAYRDYLLNAPLTVPGSPAGR